jgi:hypothetical protein
MEARSRINGASLLKNMRKEEPNMSESLTGDWRQAFKKNARAPEPTHAPRTANRHDADRLPASRANECAIPTWTANPLFECESGSALLIIYQDQKLSVGSRPTGTEA